MDKQFLKYYNRELKFIQESGGEFARQHDKIAGRLGLDGFKCTDPYVERLLEGFAFLAARVQMKIDAEFPRFTQYLLQMVYPHYLTPLPSMVVARFEPDMAEGALADGFVVPRGSVLRSLPGKDDQTACEYRTAQDVTLWPLELAGAEYLPTSGAVAALEIDDLKGATAAISLRLRTTADLTFDKLALSRSFFNFGSLANIFGPASLVGSSSDGCGMCMNRKWPSGSSCVSQRNICHDHW